MPAHGRPPELDEEALAALALHIAQGAEGARGPGVIGRFIGAAVGETVTVTDLAGRPLPVFEEQELETELSDEGEVPIGGGYVRARDYDLTVVRDDVETVTAVRTSPHHDPLSYGAIPGENEVEAADWNNLAFQEAVNAAALDGRPVVIQGMFWVSAQIEVSSGVSILGPGTAGHGLTAHQSHTGSLISNADINNGNENITIDGIELDGNKAQRTAQTTLIRMVITASQTAPEKACRSITVKNCVGHDSPTIGFQFAQVQGGWVTNNHVYDNGRDGITFYYSCQDIVVDGNLIERTDDDMIGCNAENLGAAANAQTTVGSPILSVSTTTGFTVGDGIRLELAGTDGMDLLSEIESIGVDTITLADNAETAVTRNSTTGSVGAGEDIITVASATGMVAGKRIVIAGAGRAVGQELNTSIREVIGNEVSFYTPAYRTVTNANVTVGARLTTGTNGHTMCRFAITNNILKDQTGSAGISCMGLQDSVVSGNRITRAHESGISIGNWNYQPARNLTISNNYIEYAGHDVLPETQVGAGIQIAAARTVSSYGGAAGVENITLTDNIIGWSHVNGIRVLGQAGYVVENLTINNQQVWDSGYGAEATTFGGVRCFQVHNLYVNGGKAWDTRIGAAKRQSYGLYVSTSTGELVVRGFSATKTTDTDGHAEGNFFFFGTENTSRFVIADCPGYRPWQGKATTAATAWAAGSGGFTKNVDIVFAPKFPANTVPKVFPSYYHTGQTAAVTSHPTLAANEGRRFTMWLPVDPGSVAKSVDWFAVPEGV